MPLVSQQSASIEDMRLLCMKLLLCMRLLFMSICSI